MKTAGMKMGRKVLSALIAILMLLSSDPAVFASEADPSPSETNGAATGFVAAASVSELKDGKYEADGFGWEGGSGRLEYIKCNSIAVKDGKAVAVIEFASEKYDKVKVGRETYERIGDGNSRFRIPVVLNKNMEIAGRTTAMSQAHWVDYKIYISLKKADTKGGTGTETNVNKEALDEQAPEILGLCRETNQENNLSELFQIYAYEEDLKLLQIDIGTRSVFRGQEQEAGSLYHHNIVNYLVAPKGAELPAGLGKDLVIVRTPAKALYRIDDPRAVDLKQMVTGGTDLAILENKAIKGFFFKRKKREAVWDLEKSMETLSIPLVFGRAAAERSKEAEKTWDAVYELLSK